MTVSRADPPHALQLVIDFVNTRDVEVGSDAIAEPAALATWLSERGLLAGRARVSAREHAEALDLREALRREALAHNGAGHDPQATAQLERVARRGELAVRFAPDGAVGPEPLAAGARGALARLLVPVVQACADGTWQRVKACREQECLWAFYDASRNRSGRWCDMAVCGNRTKVRTYRSRH